MERVDKILKNELFLNAVSKNEAAEEGRIYCPHNFEHLTDTARICYILNLEEKAEIKKDVIYAAALLHDTGRFMEYSEGIPHQTASIEIAKQILPSCGYSKNEEDEIIAAIDSHRHGKTQNRLGELLQKADSLSRICFRCAARSSCKWDENEMNMTLEY